jgi:hypothetical protein
MCWDYIRKEVSNLDQVDIIVISIILYLGPMKYLLFAWVFLALSIPGWSQSYSLKIPWPTDWKIATNQKTRTQVMMEYIPRTEDIDHWSTIGTTNIFIGKAGVPIEATMNITFSGAQKTAINPVLTLIDKNAEGDHPWILFKIEAEGFKSDPHPESQLYYVVEGENDLFSNFVALKKSSLPKDFVDNWTAIFKSSQFTK